MDDLTAGISLKTSRSGHIIPVIDGIHMHSMYNPVKEAQSMAEGHRDILKEKNNVLILGLGFGYHVEAFTTLLGSIHKNYQIVIIEPNKRLVELYKDNTAALKNVVILSATTEQLYENDTFVDFLMSKPLIIKHDPSYNLYFEYFKSFLTYTTPTDLKNVAKLVNNDVMRTFLQQSENADLTEEQMYLIHELDVKESQKFILMALTHLSDDSRRNSGERI